MNEADYETSSGNVFADLGLTDAKDRYLKVRLAIKISDILHKRRLSQTEAAALLGTSQAKISTISSYKLKDISLEKLLEFLTKLDQDVQITIKRKRRTEATGEITIRV